MAKLIYGLSQSLDGYVAGLAGELDVLPPPGPALFRHFSEWVRSLAGSVYGRRMYEVMRYWDEDRGEWSVDEREFALAWRRQPKWSCRARWNRSAPMRRLSPMTSQRQCVG
jgi:dihydrofolate reductase